MYKNYFKRFFDFIFSLISLLILFPLLVCIALIVAIVSKGNPFFFQKRPGLNEKIFTIIKFKTMNDKTDANGELFSDAQRLTVIGKFIRKTSLDEIPQLINVLIGNMSLIGPRPLLPEYLPLYSLEQRKRHNVRPGITGWAQVNGRNAISWKKKFEYDVWYVEHLGFKLDVQIIMKTFRKVIYFEGISVAGHVSMPRFDDYCKEKKNKCNI